MSEFPPKTGFKWTDPKDLHSNKYSGNSSKDCILEVDLECSKELCELHYQLNLDDFYNVPIGTVKTCNFSDKIMIEAKKIHCVL